MSEDFPSTWMEFNLPGETKKVAGGFYREWSHDGKGTDADQVKRMETFVGQIDKATAISKHVIILGDSNLCALKWNNAKFKYKAVVEILKVSLEQNGLHPRNLGVTFTSDIVKKKGNIATSALDHIYISSLLEDVTITSKLMIRTKFGR